MEEFISLISKSLEANTFVKITLSSPVQKDAEVHNIYVKQVEIKCERKLSFTYRYQKRDIVKNYAIDEGIENIRKHIADEFRFATLFTIAGDFVLQHNGSHFKVKQQKASITELPSLSHDRNKNRKLEASDGKKYLHLLGITDANGKVNPKSQDKFKQITHYIEILSSHIDTLPTDRTITVADMGSGKGYLTFALYDYLANTLKCKADVTGVEIRHDMVELCNKFAKESGFDGLHFAESAIDSYNVDKLDMLIALHACNTATDDALAIGVYADAQVIVAAPCCQHQIRNEMESGEPNEILSPILRHGIFMERQAELVTDSIRVLFLQYFGYKTKVVEFISDAHTHKNVMIIATKSTVSDEQKQKILSQLEALKSFFGINQHYIETKWQK
ncbi:MAG: SAM-dependent methyltransferase [Bacteroidales bacterium]|nr:SAM-dependent methyltransferase [Bacteroidales bacterium]